MSRTVSPKHISPHDDRPRQYVAVPSESDTSTRERLITAARDAFLEQGYQTTSVAKIARSAGLTTGAIYSNFSNKAALLAEAIAREGMSLWGAGLKRATTKDTPLDRAVALNTGVIAGRSRSVDRLVLEGWVGALHDQETRDQVQHNLDAIEATMRSQIDRVIEDGSLAADVDPDALVAILEALVMGGLVRRALGRSRPSEAAVEAVLHRVFRSLSSGA